jgi:hypothetical protein
MRIQESVIDIHRDTLNTLCNPNSIQSSALSAQHSASNFLYYRNGSVYDHVALGSLISTRRGLAPIVSNSTVMPNALTTITLRASPPARTSRMRRPIQESAMLSYSRDRGDLSSRLWTSWTALQLPRCRFDCTLSSAPRRRYNCSRYPLFWRLSPGSGNLVACTAFQGTAKVSRSLVENGMNKFIILSDAVLPITRLKVSPL